MKTHVIKLDSHDDVNSVRDRISWAKTERILLVFPRRSRILTRPLDLRLLQRHAKRLGAQLAIVVTSEEAGRTAKELNILVFNTTISARKQDWKFTKPPQPINRKNRPDLQTMRREAFPPEARWRSIFGIRFSFFTMGVLAILVVLSLFIPSASIKLTQATRLQTLTFTISASNEVTSVNLAGNLPVHLTSMVVEHSKTIQTTSTVSIPDIKAQGLVRFVNLTTSQVRIPSGTIVATHSIPTIPFATMTDAFVMAGVGKTMDVTVQALEPGSDGNLPADSLVAFEEVDLGTSLAVTNPSPTTGGTNRTASIQTLQDRTQLHNGLMEEILTECRNGIVQGLGPGDIFFPDTLRASQVLSEIYFPAENQSSDTISLTLRLKCEAQFASQEDIYSLAEMSLNADLPEGFSESSNVLEIHPIGIPVTDTNGITRWNIQAQRLLYANLNPLIAVQLSLGRRPAVAINQMNHSLLLSGVPEITLTPSWWPWMPLIPFRITITRGDL